MTHFENNTVDYVPPQGEFYASQDVFDKLNTYNLSCGEITYQGVRITLIKHLPENTLIATGELAKRAKELEEENETN